MPRLFFALWPDPPVREQLYSLAQAAHRAGGGRLMRRANLHQTLVFVGSVSDAQAVRVNAAGAGVHAAAFDLEFGTTGYWRHNRIVWAAPVAAPPPLAGLVDALERGLAQADVNYDNRPYSPHVTLVRDSRPPVLPPPARFEWRVRDFALVESARDSTGVAYRVIARWPLAV